MRCKACGNDWRAMPEDAPLELNEDVAETAAAAFGKSDTKLEESLEDDVTTAPLTQAFRARAEQKRRTRQAVRQGLAWSLMIVLMLVGFLAAYIWRDNIVARIPKLASAYQMVGIETNPIGLDFEAITTGFARNDISQIYVSGALRNLRDREIVAPPIRIALIDRTGREYDHHILHLEGAPVLPGGVRGFAVILPNTDGRFAETRLRLVPDEVAKKPEERPAASPARKAAPETAPAIAPKPQAKAETATDTDGLRRISQLTPSSAIGRSDLDTAPFEGVSAGHG